MHTVTAGVPTESRVKAAHRAQQGWWREALLHRPPGAPTQRSARDRYSTLSNYLPAEFEGRTAAQEGLNLMPEAARTYARARQIELVDIAGLAQGDRLWRNMLSSQPLAFSIAGELREHPEAAAALSADLTGLPVTALDTLTDDTHPLNGVDAEWFPQRELYTRDLSGFDLAAALRLEDGTRVLLTVEVKYVDSFSPAKLDPGDYADHLSAVGISLDSAAALVKAGCSQFLRSVLLTDSVRRTGIRGEGGVDSTIAVVLARGDDGTASRVVDAIAVHAPPTTVAFWSHERFFAAAARQPALAGWAAQLQARYLLSGAGSSAASTYSDWGA